MWMVPCWCLDLGWSPVNWCLDSGWGHVGAWIVEVDGALLVPREWILPRWYVDKGSFYLTPAAVEMYRPTGYYTIS